MSTHVISGVSNVLLSDASILSIEAQSYICPSTNSHVFQDEGEEKVETTLPVNYNDDSSEDDEEPAFGHMTEKTFNKLAAKYNMNDLGVSDHKKSLTSLVHRVRRKEKAVETYVQKAIEHSERKVEKRGKLVNKVATMESVRMKHKEENKDLKDKFLIEVDKAVEEKNQNIADRRYHLQQVDLAVPPWVKKLMDARIVVVSLGHNPALKWRSKTKAIIEEAVRNAENSDLSDKFKLRLRRLREVNLMSANEFCVELKKLYTEYMEENSKNDSKLGKHSKSYLQVLAAREGKQEILPLASHEWSDDLSLGARTVGSENLVSTLAPTISTYSTAPVTLEGSSFSVGMKNISTKRSLEFKPPSDPRFNDVQGQALTQLRFAASEGDFDLAWSIFRNNFDLQQMSARYLARSSSPVRNGKSSLVLNNEKNSSSISKGSGTEKSEIVITEEKSQEIVNNFSVSSMYGNDHSESKRDGAESLVRQVDRVNVERMLKSIPPGWKAPKLEVFRLLMTAFKNSNGNWDDSHFKDAEAVVNACYGNGFRPDLTIMNTMLGACVHESMWRRGICVVKDMQMYHDLVPTVHTFDILLDCCRHAIDEPAIIFQTLRLEGLPREYCYKAAVVNAGNRITPQVALESLYEINKIPSITNGLTESYVYGKTYMPPIMRKTEYAPNLPKKKGRSNKRIGNSIDSPYASATTSTKQDSHGFDGGAVSRSDLDFSTSSSSFASSTIDSVSTFKGFPSMLTSSLFNTNDYDNGIEKPVFQATLAKKQKQRKWTLYRDSMKNQLPRHSPGKLLTTKSVRPFEKQIEKVLNANLKGVHGGRRRNDDSFAKASGFAYDKNKSSKDYFGSTSIEAEMSELELDASEISPSTVVNRPFDPNVSWISDVEPEDNKLSSWLKDDEEEDA